MNPATALDDITAEVLDLAWLRAAVAPQSAYGRRAFDALRAFAPGEHAAAQARAERIVAVRDAAGAGGLDAACGLLQNVPDAAAAVARASMGDALGDAEFFALARFCDAAQRIGEMLGEAGGVPSSQNDAVRALGAALEPARRRSPGFYLDDGFDPALPAARREHERAQAELDAARGRCVERIARELGRSDLAGDEFIVMRAGATGALPEGVRVVREAPTYLLCAIDYDDAMLAALARRDGAAQATAAVEEAVRLRLSGIVADVAPQLDSAMRALGEIDVLVSAARFALRCDCCVPQVVDEPVLAFEGGRFLPLAAELESQGRAFAPIDVDLHDLAVLTGPNMGGKSVCLRTCGAIAACAAFGLPVPARSARVGLFDAIAWLGIGADREAGGLLSSYAREIVRLRDVLARDAPRLLVLIDEFARTTTPHEGRALLIAVLDRLRSRRACGLVATHLAGIAAETGVRHFAVRGLRGFPKRPAAGTLDGALAALAASMDYTIVEVAGGEMPGADAIALAELLGLDEALIAAARDALRAPGR